MKKYYIIGCLIHLLIALSCQAQKIEVEYAEDAEQLLTLAAHLYSPVVLQARHIQNQQLTTEQAAHRLKQACLLVEAAAELAPNHPELWHDALKLYITDAIDDPGRAAEARFRYSRLATPHFSVQKDWLQYQHNKYNNREEREAFIIQMLNEYSNNPGVSGILLNQYAEMQAQVGQFVSDPENKVVGAIDLYARSVQLYPYNTHAITSMLAVPPGKGDVNYSILELILYRQQIRNNPFRIDALLNLIRKLDEEGLFALAQNYYLASYRFLEWKEEDSSIIHDLKLNQLFSLYSAELYNEALGICEDILRSEPNQLVALSMKSKCYEKAGNEKRYSKTVEQSQQVANALWRQWQTDGNPETQALLAWYYCLVSPHPQRAMEITNTKVESASNQNLINFRCYSSMLSGDTEQTKSLLQEADATEPAVALIWAIIEKNQKNYPQAFDRLNAIDRYPKGLIADYIKLEYQQLLELIERSKETNTVSAFNNETIKATAQQLMRGNYDDRDFEIPYNPLKYLRCSIRILSSKDTFTYNDPIVAKVYLTNNGDTPVVLGPDNFVNPSILILADIEPIDRVAAITTKSNPKDSKCSANAHLVTFRTLDERQVLSPGESNIITQSLNIGKVRDILQTYPQKSFQISYQVILDPFQEKQGAFVGYMPQIQPKPFTLWRKAFKPSQNNLKKLFEMTRHGSSNEKIAAVQTIGGLLRESYLVDMGQARYAVSPLKNRDLLRSWISSTLTDEDFRVQAWSAFSLRNLPLAENPRELKQLTQLLNSPNAFVRFMVVHTLDSAVNLQGYYQWTLKNEEMNLITRQALWKTDQPWPTQPCPYDKLIESRKAALPEPAATSGSS